MSPLRRAVLLALAAIVLLSLACSPLRDARRAEASRLQHETVALVHLDEDGDLQPYCTGVWVSPAKVLTAEHCVEDLGMPPELELAKIFAAEFPGVAPPPPPWDPTGQKARYAVLEDANGPELLDRDRGAIVISIDRKADLALLETVPGGPDHPYATLGEAPRAGDRVEVCGHPGGLLWSFEAGTVAGSRWEPSPNDPELGRVLWTQFSAPGVWFGNSGSGLFDDEDRLVGIVSFLAGKSSGIAFAVHRDELRRFLKDLRVIRP